ncbi:MAG: non-homologous end-joining DNA ligase, partial [Acidimicrobiia bacterium]|nr:non-homologous end-joining DNA ligase [Acidimicrobiia bacterium]
EPNIPAATSETKTSNLDKVFWPDEGYTKGDLIDYYRTVAPSLLPYLADRPLTLVRFPDGIDGKSFFQKNAPDFVPTSIRTEWIDSSNPDEGSAGNNFFVCESVEALTYIINLGAIPLHVRASRVASIDRPDWCVLDLDPKTAPFTAVVQVARAIRSLCDDIDLPCYVKTSGKTGLHILIPMGPRYDFEQQKLLGELIARVIEGQMPDIATTIRSPSKRGDKVYLDFVQNGRGKLIVGPYSVRPVPGATVSTPLRWSEVTPKLDPTRFTIRSAPRRIGRMTNDPLAPVLTDRPDIAASLRALAAKM